MVENITDDTQALQFTGINAADYCTVWNGDEFQYVIHSEVPFSDYLVADPAVQAVSTDVSQLVSDDVGICEVPTIVVSDLVTGPPVDTVSIEVAQPVSDDGVSQHCKVPTDIISDELVTEPQAETVFTDVNQLVSDDLSTSGRTVTVSSFYGRSSGTGKFSISDSDIACCCFVCCYSAHLYLVFDCRFCPVL